jgi:hypothetical protein
VLGIIMALNPGRVRVNIIITFILLTQVPKFGFDGQLVTILIQDKNMLLHIDFGHNEQ